MPSLNSFSHLFIIKLHLTMNVIKHVLNLMFLWTVPFIITGMLLLLSLGSFDYHECITSGPWIGFYFIYSIIIAGGYFCHDPKRSMDLFKTN